MPGRAPLRVQGLSWDLTPGWISFARGEIPKRQGSPTETLTQTIFAGYFALWKFTVTELELGSQIRSELKSNHDGACRGRVVELALERLSSSSSSRAAPSLLRSSRILYYTILYYTILCSTLLHHTILLYYSRERSGPRELSARRPRYDASQTSHAMGSVRGSAHARLQVSTPHSTSPYSNYSAIRQTHDKHPIPCHSRRAARRSLPERCFSCSPCGASQRVRRVHGTLYPCLQADQGAGQPANLASWPADQLVRHTRQPAPSLSSSVADHESRNQSNTIRNQTTITFEHSKRAQHKYTTFNNDDDDSSGNNNQ